ncbi:MAG: cell division protein SepF [Lachnospiraceae bacterium]|nr:cell division protein SepF [Lachnospiraceae bacterium]
MSVLDKFINSIKLTDGPEDDEDYLDDEYMDDEDDFQEDPPKKEQPVKLAQVKPSRQSYLDDDDEPAEREKPAPAPRKAASGNKVSQMKTVKRNDNMEVCVIRPNSVEDTREITDTLLLGTTVVLNLEGLDMKVAQRIIDFTSGSCYAIRGNLQKISQYIFIITPASVDISGDFQEIFGGSFDVPVKNNDF